MGMDDSGRSKDSTERAPVVERERAVDESQGDAPLAAIAHATAAQQYQRDAATWIGRCLQAHDPEHPGKSLVGYVDERGALAERWLDQLGHAAPAVGDEVLLTTPRNRSAPLVIGRLGTGPVDPLHLPGGYQLQVDDKRRRATLLRPDGTLAMELDLAGDAPILQLPEEDLALEIAGRLSISAGSIELVSTDGEVRVEASEDVRVRGKRIWLN